VTTDGVVLTSPDRVLWPERGFTKGQMVAYYEAVAPVMLPHLARRPMTLYRAPEGIDTAGWYQTECRGAPSWMATVEVRGARGAGQRYCVIETLDGLLWAANRGAIEFHPLPTRIDRLGEPTAVVFDLDPGPAASIADCCRVALLLRDALDGSGLTPVVKTSGSAGLHVVAAIAPGQTFAASKQFVREHARTLARQHPSLVVDRSVRAERHGRVFVDWVANDLVRSIVAPYSLRAVAWPVASTPLNWEEVAATAERGTGEGMWFLPGAVLGRVERHGDLFAAALERGANLPG
jgi:bifunctional non-homologous end joining protein LigD